MRGDRCVYTGVCEPTVAVESGLRAVFWRENMTTGTGREAGWFNRLISPRQFAGGEEGMTAQ